MDLKEVLKTYIPIWGWKGTIDELLEYWWAGENTLNTPVIKIIDDLRSKGMKCYLATDQEKYRANYIMKGMELGDHIDKAFFSSELGLSKATPEYWHAVMHTLEIENPADVTYWDDEQENVDAAKELGIDAHLYTTISDLEYLTKN